MSAHEVEVTLARVYTDPSFRRAFLSDPLAALQPLDLTSEEKADLARIDRAGLMMAAASYHHKRAQHVTVRRRGPRRLQKLIVRAMRLVRRLGPPR
jgi:hypothetical protein